MLECMCAACNYDSRAYVKLEFHVKMCHKHGQAFRFDKIYNQQTAITCDDCEIWENAGKFYHRFESHRLNGKLTSDIVEEERIAEIAELRATADEMEKQQ